MGLDPLELGDHLVVGRRGGDDLADRRRVVEDVAERRPERRDVELASAAKPLLLGDGEHQLEPARRLLGPRVRRQLHQDRDRRLVVGAQDRLARAAKDAIGQDHLDRLRVRDRVHVGEERDPRLRAPGNAADQVAGVRVGPLGRVVLFHLEAEALEAAP